MEKFQLGSYRMPKILSIKLIIFLSLTGIFLDAEEFNPELKKGTIEIHIQKLRNNNGYVRIALYTSSDTFCKKGKEFRAIVIKPKEKKVIVHISEIPFGEYAIALYHDENNDDKFNKGLFNIVFRERFGFSNNIRPIFTSPEFEKTKFFLGSEFQSITITAQ